jgi:predicted nucleic-acid-binding protein
MKKVFFDTNFLLRFYLDDVPTQAIKAKRMVQAAKEGSLLLVTDLIVICEMVWVMDSFYGLDKAEISEKMTNLYQTPGIVIINSEILPDALDIYVNKNIDFTDAVILCRRPAGWIGLWCTCTTAPDALTISVSIE